MAQTIVKHKIKKPTHDEPLIMLNNCETVLFGAERIDVGVNTGEEVIKTNPITGENYLTTETAAQTIYDLHKQKHKSWFVIDLETGSRGYYPGKK